MDYHRLLMPGKRRSDILTTGSDVEIPDTMKEKVLRKPKVRWITIGKYKILSKY
jgi:hypothetical protein